MLQQLFDIFNQGWVGSLIGFVGIVIGILGIFSYRISKSSGKPTIQKYSLRIIGKEDTEVEDDIEILYKGTKVDRLTKTIIVFWNNGTETIDGKDVVPTDPITFSFSDGEKIISQKIVKSTREVNNPKVSTPVGADNSAVIEFDFLDPNDGFTIEFLHTDTKRYPNYSGTIKGVPSGIYDAGRVIADSMPTGKTPFGIIFKSRRKIMYLALIIGLVAFSIGFLPSSIYEYVDSIVKPSGSSGAFERWFFIIFGATYSSLAAFVLWSGRRKYPRKLEVSNEGS